MAAADSPAARRRGRELTREEQELWQRAMRDATPLPPAARSGVPGGAAADAPAQPREPAPASPREPAPAAANQPARARFLPAGHASLPRRWEQELTLGRTAGIDRRTAERLRRGRLAIEARLDLHGMTRTAARDALTAFIERTADRGQRCVLVITGKGSTGDGVLKREVPHWLNLPALRGRIVGFVEAQPRHGGAGALYVLLRRRREG